MARFGIMTGEHGAWVARDANTDVEICVCASFEEFKGKLAALLRERGAKDKEVPMLLWEIETNPYGISL